MRKSVSIIFQEPPEQWGLRGDPYLWSDLEIYFSNGFFPCTEEHFMKEFYTAFEKLTGSKLESKEQIFVPQYNHGGMSGGMVDSTFWLDKALPLLINRLQKANIVN